VIILELLWYFLAGAFAFNGLPHLVKGITGQPNMTPFAKVSSPILNIVWAFVNFGLALYLLGLASGLGGLTPPWDAHLVEMNLWVFLGGALVMSLMCANLFGKKDAHLPWQK
jgi:hypothetical protein